MSEQNNLSSVGMNGEARSHGLEMTDFDAEHRGFELLRARISLGVGIVSYPLMWLFFEASPHPAFDPFWGRLLAITPAALILASTLFKNFKPEYTHVYLSFFAWIVTGHSLNLLRLSAFEPQRVASTFIVVAACAAILSSRKTVLTYSLFVFAATFFSWELTGTQAFPSWVLPLALGVIPAFSLATEFGKNRLFDLLAKSRKEVRMILDNLGQGFLVINSKGIVQPGVSAMVERIFSKEPTGKSFSGLLGMKGVELDNWRNWLLMTFREDLPFETLKSLGPRSFYTPEGNYIELDYRAIYEKKGSSDRVSRIICIASDKTLQKQLQAQFEQQQARVKRIIAILENRVAFAEFVQTARDILARLPASIPKSVNDPEMKKQVLRELHSIKGVAALFQLNEISKMSHALEYELSVSLQIPELDIRVLAISELFEEILMEDRQLIGSFDEENSGFRTFDEAECQKLLEVASTELPYNSQALRELEQHLILDPISDSFTRYRAVSENIAERQGKQIDFIVTPSDTRVVVGMYQDFIRSCVHLFRNAVDHGLEQPHERIRAGKSAAGTIRVDFVEAAGKIKIIVSDDGRGLDSEKIRASAVRKGRLTPDQASKLTKEELYGLLFESGFTTREQASDISGRGVGLDAVKSEVVRLGGSVKVESELGKGTRFTLEIPLLLEALRPYTREGNSRTVQAA